MENANQAGGLTNEQIIGFITTALQSNGTIHLKQEELISKIGNFSKRNSLICIEHKSNLQQPAKTLQTISGL